MSIFTDKEKRLLVRLQHDETWTSLLKKLSEFGEVPRFNAQHNPVEQSAKWIYHNGKRDGRLDIIQTFLNVELTETE